MGTWGYKALDNDGAADWLNDLEETSDPKLLLSAIRAVTKSKGKVDLDDALEGLVAAEVLCASRYEPPRGVPRSACKWIKRVGLVPNNQNLRAAAQAVAKIGKNSELSDSWKSEGNLLSWTRELEKLSERLSAALRVPLPVRKGNPRATRETLAELILTVAEDPKKSRRPELQKKLVALANPDGPVGGKWKGEKLNRLTPLHWTASRGLVPEARLLVEHGATVSVDLPPMSPPIDFAINNNHMEMVEFLLKAGADRQRALLTAIREDHIPVLNMVLSLGVDINAKQDAGWTPVLWAAHTGSPNALKILLKSGGRMDDKLETGDTVLHLATEAPLFANDGGKDPRFLSTVKLLITHGAELNVSNAENKTPLDVAEETGVPSILRLLRSNGAKRSIAV